MIKGFSTALITLFLFGLTCAQPIVDQPGAGVAEAKLVRSKLINLSITATRDGNSIPISKVPKLEPGDKIKVVPQHDDSFFNAGFSVLVTVFLPVNEFDPIVGNGKIVVESRTLKQCKSGQSNCDGDETNEQNTCLRNCTFVVPSYSSVPLIFMVTKNDSWTQRIAGNSSAKYLKDLAVREHATFLEYGETSYSYTITPRKLNFLLDLEKILKSPAAPSGKVVQNLFDVAFAHFKLDEKNECPQPNQGTGTQKRLAQLNCVIEKNRTVIQSITSNEQLSNSLNWNTLSLKIAEVAVQQLKLKFPKLDGYLQLVSTVIALMQPLLDKWFGGEAIVVTSAISTETQTRSLYQIYAVRDRAKGKDVENPSGQFRRAIFFMPLRAFEEEAPVNLSEKEIQAIKPLYPCLVPEVNRFTLPNILNSEQKGMDYEVRITGPGGNQIPEMGDIKIASSSLGVGASYIVPRSALNSDLPKQLRASLEFKYNFGSFASTPVDIGVSRPQVWRVNQDDGDRIRIGANGKFVIEGDNSSCIEKVVFTRPDGQKIEYVNPNIAELAPQDIGDNQTLRTFELPGDSPGKIRMSLSDKELGNITPGIGKVLVYQYGQKSQEIPVTVHPRLQVTEVVFIPGDTSGRLKLSDSTTPKDFQDARINHVVLNGSESYPFDTRKMTISGLTENALSDVRTVSLKSDLETIPISPEIKILDRRITLKSDVCGNRSLNEGQIAISWNSEAYHSFDPCDVIASDASIVSIKLQPSEQELDYDFTQRQPTPKVWLANLNPNSSQSGPCSSNEDVPFNEASLLNLLTVEPYLMTINVNLNDPQIRKVLPCPGWGMRVKLLEPQTLNESEILTVAQSFVVLPRDLKLVCNGNQEKPCKFTSNGNGHRSVLKVSLNGNDPGNFQDFSLDRTYPRPSSNESVWIMLRNRTALNLNADAISLVEVAGQ
jgi:hypothetical protein